MIDKLIRDIVILVIFFCFFAFQDISTLYSHPHVWIDTTTTVISKDGFFQGVENHWEFDEYFSMDIMDVVDSNGNGKVEENEKERAFNETFVHLKEFDYYNHVSLNGQKIKDYRIENFDAKIENNIVIYDFKFVLNNPIEISKNNKITVSIYDDTYFIDIKLGNEENIKFTSKTDLINYQIIEDKENAIWYGMVFPKTILIQGKNKLLK